MIRVCLQRADAQSPQFSSIHRGLCLAGEVVPFGQINLLTLEKLLNAFSTKSFLKVIQQSCPDLVVVFRLASEQDSLLNHAAARALDDVIRKLDEVSSKRERRFIGILGLDFVEAPGQHDSLGRLGRMDIVEQRLATVIEIEAPDLDVELACTEVNGVVRDHAYTQEPVDGFLLAFLVLIVVKR